MNEEGHSRADTAVHPQGVWGGAPEKRQCVLRPSDGPENRADLALKPCKNYPSGLILGFGAGSGAASPAACSASAIAWA